MSLQSEDPGTGGVETGPMRATGRVVVIAFAVGLLLAGCNGSGGTGPTQPVVISNLQARTLERPLDDRPFKLEISVTVSEPKRVVGATAALRRLRLPQETCAAPGSSPIVATTPITPANLEGNRLRVVLQPRLPSGRSRLCVFAALAESLPQKTRGSGIAETPVNQTNELDLVLDVAPAKGGAANGGTTGGAPKAASPPGGSPPVPPPPPPPDPALPVVTIAAPDSSAAESPSDTGTFQVSRTGSTSAPLTVVLQRRRDGVELGLQRHRDERDDPGGRGLGEHHGDSDQRQRVRTVRDRRARALAQSCGLLSRWSQHGHGQHRQRGRGDVGHDQFPGSERYRVPLRQPRHEQRREGLERDRHASFNLRLGGSASPSTPLPGSTGFRFQKDLNSESFVTETSIGSVEMTAGTTVRASSVGSTQSPVTYRVFVHIGHPP